jgi:hypothetical protein
MAEKSLQLYRPEEYVAYANTDLSPEDLTVLTEYLAAGGHPLSPDASARMFELFLNGSDAREIQRINKAFPLGGILDAQVRYKWTQKRDDYCSELQDKIKTKVLKAQMETTELMTDMLAAARRKHSDKLKKFIQSGDEKDLDGVINIESLQGLLKVTEGLLKITGQDRVIKTKTENTQNFNVNVNTGTSDLSPEDAAAVLKIMSDAKKKKAVSDAKS